jgi:hypothetical protein
LPGPDEETPGPLDAGKVYAVRGKCNVEFLARKRSEADRPDQFLGRLPQNAEEMSNFAVDVVIGLDGRRISVE